MASSGSGADGPLLLADSCGSRWRRWSPYIALVSSCACVVLLLLRVVEQQPAAGHQAFSPTTSSLFTTDSTHLRPSTQPRHRSPLIPSPAALSGGDGWQEAYGPFGPTRDALTSMRNNVGGSVMLAGQLIHTNWAPRACVVGTHESDWAFFAHLIANTTAPFAVVRYGDGERMLAQGDAVSQSTQAFSADKFWWEGGESEIGADMRRSLKGHYGQNYYYGFASPLDDVTGMKWFLAHTEQHCTFITYANLWVNAFYQRTKAMLTALLAEQHARIVLVINYEAAARYAAITPVQSRVPPERVLDLPDDAAHVWQGDTRLSMLANATALARSQKGRLFLISGGPLAKVLIDAMWAEAPQNQYVDLGSAMDEILKGRQTRPYMDSGTGYAAQVDPPWWIHPNGVPVML